jgi:hypothetical protein
MAMYAFDTQHRGTLIPYTRWSQLHGSYSTQKNAPYGNNFELASGLEWILFKELELTVEATLVNRVNTTAINQPSEVSYRNFDGSVLRLQAQMNY